jgi:hypothetical protein
VNGQIEKKSVTGVFPRGKKIKNAANIGFHGI